MPRPTAKISDSIGRAFVDSGVELSLKRFGKPSEVVARLVGVAALTDLLPNVCEITGISSLGAFYRRWKTAEELNETVVAEIMTDAYAAEPRSGLLFAKLKDHLKDVDRTLPISDHLRIFGESYTEALASLDPYVPVRWHLHPYYETLQFDDGKVIEAAGGVIGIIHQWIGAEFPEELSVQNDLARNFLLAADCQALSMQITATKERS